MANPYRSQAKSTSAAKFRAISGKSSSGKPFDASPENSDRIAKAMKGTGTSGPENAGGRSKPRLDKYARGGGVGKGKTNITINISGKGGEEKQPVPIPIPMPMGGPGGPPPGPPPMEAPPPGPIPGPMMRKSGGRVKMKGGADTGVGRLDKVKAYKRG